MSISHHFTIRCSACDGGIEFPAYGIGQIIECPHCEKQVTLAFPPDQGSPTQQLRIFLQSVSFPVIEQELFALSLFACPNECSVLTQYSIRFATVEAWPRNVIRRFIADGFLCDASNDLTILLQMESAATLKLLAKERGLPSSGTKETLAKKLTETDSEAMRKRFHERQFWVCSTKGRMLVEKWNDARKNHENVATTRCHSALLKGQFDEACLVIKEYQGSHQSFMSGGIDDYNHEVSSDLEIIQTIFHSRLSRHEHIAPCILEEIRVAAAMIHLLGTNNPSRWISNTVKQWDLNSDLDARILLFHALGKSRVSGMKNAGILRVEVLGADLSEVCQVCRSDSGKIYQIDCAPVLPHEGCTCEDGCMCMAIAKK